MTENKVCSICNGENGEKCSLRRGSAVANIEESRPKIRDEIFYFPRDRHRTTTRLLFT